MRVDPIIQNEQKVRFINQMTRKNQTNLDFIRDYAVFPKQQIINQVNYDLQHSTDELITKNLNRLLIDLQALPGNAGTLVKAWIATNSSDTNYQKPHVLSNANLDELLVDLILRGYDVDLNPDIKGAYNTVVLAYITAQDAKVYSIEPHKCPLHLSFVPIDELTNNSLMTFERIGFSGQYSLAEIRFINDSSDRDDLIHDFHIQRGYTNIQTQSFQELKLLKMI